MITKENKVFCDSEKEINFYKNQIEGLMIKIAALQKENEKLKAKSRWISLREQMPENTEEVLVCTLSALSQKTAEEILTKVIEALTGLFTEDARKLLTGCRFRRCPGRIKNGQAIRDKKRGTGL